MDIDNHTYKLRFWSSVKPLLWPLFVTIVFTAGFIPILATTANSDSFLFALIVAIIWISLTGIPPVVLEINYIFHDWETKLKIDQTNNVVEISRRDEINRFKIQDIIQIEKHHSGLEKGDRVARMHWHTFYYYRLLVRNHEPVLISRMIITNLEKKIENVKYKMSWNRFPIIRG